MKVKTGILAIVFLVFYAMVHLGGHLPDLYYGKFSYIDERSYDQRLMSLLTDILMSFLFTLSTYYALYCFYPRRRYISLICILVVAFITCFTMSYWGTQWLSADHLRISRFFRTEVLYNAFYCIFAMVFYFVQYAQFKELQERDLALENRLASLSFLRSQINPHFLFNNLNNIYSMVYHNSAQSLPAISGLSDLLRYMIYDDKDMSTLEKEVHYIEQYIALEQLRFEAPSKIKFNYTNDGLPAQLPPLLLIPFVENAFKHGNISSEREWLTITISTTASNQILLNCTNEVRVKRKDLTGGIGIDNVRKRLALLYPDNHNLTISQHQDKFTVNLTLGIYRQL
ncbi:sensor histidine kinase [Pedobacter duraquae]|uniref:Histidine kinase n=1 Tax=Pedobacter duraquae TaxID=425511 RepID=A0A4R6ICJ0_9SPHI|nr:sensor histidine kinase [Pedobacter duraquae]TDO19973.1 histidine kinase [Pedobacter duraquae]